MADIKKLVDLAEEGGMSREEVISGLRERGASQRDIDRAEMEFINRQLGGLGVTRNVALGVPRFFLPKTTEEVETGLYQTGANIRDLLGGNVEAVKARGQEVQAIPTEALKELGITTALNLAGGAVGNKILPPIMRKLPFLALPSTVKKTAQTLYRQTFSKIDDILQSAGKQGRTLPISQIIKEIEPLIDEVVNANDEAGFKQLNQIVGQVTGLGDEINPKQTFSLAKNLKEKAKLFSAATGKAKELSGVGTRAASTISQKAYQSLKELVPEVVQPLKEYGTLANVSRQMGKPLAGSSKGLMSFFFTEPLRNLGLISPVTQSLATTGTFAGATAYPRYLLQQGLGRVAQPASALLSAAINQLRNLNVSSDVVRQ